MQFIPVMAKLNFQQLFIQWRTHVSSHIILICCSRIIHYCHVENCCGA